jgi:hypothetical protein
MILGDRQAAVLGPQKSFMLLFEDVIGYGGGAKS